MGKLFLLCLLREADVIVVNEQDTLILGNKLEVIKSIMTETK